MPKCTKRVRRPDPSLLVVCAPRSGSMFTATRLRRTGINVKHEHSGSDVAIGWHYAVTDDYLGKHRRDGRKWFKHATIAHQVREPLASIASLQVWLHQYAADAHLDLIDKYVQIAGLPPLDAAVRVWVEWNVMCELAASWTYRVESLVEGSDEWFQLCELAGGNGEWHPTPVREKRLATPTLLWEQVLETPDGDRAAEAAARYGYAV